MSRPKNADGQRTRQALLDAALDLFAEKGFFGTSLRDVAAAVGVRESAIYNYFPGKDALFEALVVTNHEAKTERLAALAAGPVTNGRTALERFTVAMLAGFVEPRQEQLFRILMSDGIRLAKDGRLNLIERLGNDGRGPTHELLRRLIRAGVIRNSDLSMLVIAFVSPLILWRQVRAIDPTLPMVRNPEAFARQHVDQFLRGAAVPATAVATTPATRRRTRSARTTSLRARRLA